MFEGQTLGYKVGYSVVERVGSLTGTNEGVRVGETGNNELGNGEDIEVGSLLGN